MTFTEPTHPTVGAPPSEIAPSICAVAFDGPPVASVAAPSLILGLALALLAGAASAAARRIRP